jgi:hypothetical protein
MGDDGLDWRRWYASRVPIEPTPSWMVSKQARQRWEVTYHMITHCLAGLGTIEGVKGVEEGVVERSPPRDRDVRWIVAVSRVRGISRVYLPMY